MQWTLVLRAALWNQSILRFIHSIIIEQLLQSSMLSGRTFPLMCVHEKQSSSKILSSNRKESRTSTCMSLYIVTFLNYVVPNAHYCILWLPINRFSGFLSHRLVTTIPFVTMMSAILTDVSSVRRVNGRSPEKWSIHFLCTPYHVHHRADIGWLEWSEPSCFIRWRHVSKDDWRWIWFFSFTRKSKINAWILVDRWLKEREENRLYSPVSPLSFLFSLGYFCLHHYDNDHRDGSLDDWRRGWFRHHWTQCDEWKMEKWTDHMHLYSSVVLCYLFLEMRDRPQVVTRKVVVLFGRRNFSSRGDQHGMFLPYENIFPLETFLGFKTFSFSQCSKRYFWTPY